MAAVHDADLRVPLTSDVETAAPVIKRSEYSFKDCWHPDAFLWRALHVIAFLTGGTTFIGGTAVLFFPGYDFLSALLYTIGSTGFLVVDVQEFYTYTKDPVLRTNILLSATGSFMYLVGSVGFFPTVAAVSPLFGIWGFVIGSAFIGWSQLWKTHRIGGGEDSEGFHLSAFTNSENFTAAGVELGAGIGAWCFFFGTLLFNWGPLEGAGSVLTTVLYMWVAGSVFFTIGGCFLAFRHFVMDVA